MAEFQNQALELEQKFYDQFESEYNERSAVIGGIPEFWLSAMKNQPSIAEIITPRDEPALRHLTDIRMKYLNPASSGFCLSFHFSENKFFTNAVLTKTYRYEKGSDYTGELTYGKTSGDEILWRRGKNLTFEEVEIGEMNNSKSSGRALQLRRLTGHLWQSRAKSEKVRNQSFTWQIHFSTFSPHRIPRPQKTRMPWKTSSGCWMTVLAARNLKRRSFLMLSIGTPAKLRCLRKLVVKPARVMMMMTLVMKEARALKSEEEKAMGL